MNTLNYDEYFNNWGEWVRQPQEFKYTLYSKTPIYQASWGKELRPVNQEARASLVVQDLLWSIDL